MSLRIYGISNCSTMKKARNWLEEAGVAHVFHDYRKDGIQRADLERWCDELGWDKVVNRSGMTYRKLPEEARAGMDRESAIAAMLEQPAMVRRPILEGKGILLAGFREAQYEAALTAS